MSTRFLNQSPLQITARHAMMATGTLIVAVLGGFGAIQAFGNPNDIGPKVSLVLAMPAGLKSGEKTHASGDQTQTQVLGSLVLNPGPMPEGMVAPGMAGTGAPVEFQNGAGVGLPVPGMDGYAPGSPMAQQSGVTVGENPDLDMPPVSGQARIMVPSANGNVRTVSLGAKGTPLPPAPFPGLTVPSSGGVLPVIGPGGRRSADAYARPFADSGAPKIALVVGGLGLNARVSQRAIDELPPEVTLSFVPYAENLQRWIDKARAAGHEVLIELPMEPFDYPDNDPGPQTLLSTASGDENIRRLEYLLSRANGYFGVANYLGAKFASVDAASTPVLTALKSRGLVMVSDGGGRFQGTAKKVGLGYVGADRIVDSRPSVEDISAQLGALEAAAQQKGSALGFGVAYPVTIEQIAQWARSLRSKGIVLAPASATLRARAAG